MSAMPAPAQASPPPSAQPGSPPFGSSPATGPTPNRGIEATGLSLLGVIIKQMSMAVPLVGANTDAGQDLLKALQLIAKHVPAGAVTPADQKNSLQGLMMKQQQTGPASAAQSAQAA